MYGDRAAWSRLFYSGAGADPSRSEPEPESASGPWRPGAEADSGAAPVRNTATGTVQKYQQSRIHSFIYMLFHFLLDPDPDPCGSGSTTLIIIIQ